MGKCAGGRLGGKIRQLGNYKDLCPLQPCWQSPPIRVRADSPFPPMGFRPNLYFSALLVIALILGLPLFAGLEVTLREGTQSLNLAWHSTQIGKSVFVALFATIISLISALGIAAHFQMRTQLITWLSLPLLAIPHAAVAQALGLLLSPSGFLVRALSPEITGYTHPPSDWLWDQHPAGWTLIVALAIKELPFLLILIYTYSATLPTHSWTRAAQCLGYNPAAGWWHLTLPHILPRLVLPLFVIVAFCVSVVDVAALVGPSRLKTFAHSLQQAWQSDTPPSEVLAGAIWMLLVTLALLLLMWGLVHLSVRGMIGAMSWQRGHVGLRAGSSPGLGTRLRPRLGTGFGERFGESLGPGLGLPRLGAIMGLGLYTLAYLSLALYPLQSIIETSGRRTHFPDLWTGNFGLKAWDQALNLALPTLPTTLLIGGMATGISLIGILWLLEGESRNARPAPALDTVLLMPLFIPQFAFLSGGAFLGLKWGLIPGLGWPVAVWFHTLFIMPYVFLVLAPAYRGFDRNLVTMGASLGLGPGRLFWRLKLPILLRPILYALAWGMAVSLALYLPTFFASGGRFQTLLTVGVTQLAGKGDSVRAVWGLLLLMLPLCFFGLVTLISALQSANRRGLRT